MKISIITVSYNSVSTIEDTIKSVVGQTYFDDVEYIVIDGDSTDGTVVIIKRYGAVISRWVSERDGGIYDAMNKGMSMATGDVIGVLNSDDVYAGRDVISRVAGTLEKTGADSCYGDLLYVDSVDTDKVRRYWKSGPYNTGLFYGGWMPPHPTFFVRRGVYERYGFFNLSLGSSADYELMVRFLLKRGISACYIPDVLVKMRSGGVSNASVGNRVKANRMDRLAWEVNGLKPYPWTFLMKPLRKVGQFFSRP
ncbi:MAG: glycosyltransferase family 2 protein [Nitrospirota bacterium]